MRDIQQQLHAHTVSPARDHGMGIKPSASPRPQISPAVIDLAPPAKRVALDACRSVQSRSTQRLKNCRPRESLNARVCCAIGAQARGPRAQPLSPPRAAFCRRPAPFAFDAAIGRARVQIFQRSPNPVGSCFASLARRHFCREIAGM